MCFIFQEQPVGTKTSGNSIILDDSKISSKTSAQMEESSTQLGYTTNSNMNWTGEMQTKDDLKSLLKSKTADTISLSAKKEETIVAEYDK